jgi:hypothetical protein
LVCRTASPRGCVRAARHRVNPTQDSASSSPAYAARAIHQVEQTAVDSAQMGAGARPSPGGALVRQARPQRILLDINHSCPEMFFVHGHGVITCLP